MSDVDPIVDEAAASPRRVVIDGQDVQTHDLSQLIEYDRYKKSVAASSGAGSNPFTGVRMGKCSHPRTY